MESLEKRIRSVSIISGLILGAVLLTLSILSFYFITGMPDSAILVVILPVLFSIMLPIVTVVLICVNVRKRIGGYWNLRQATTGIFIMFIIAYAVQTIGRDLVFARLVEPNMVQKTEAAMLKTNAFIKKKTGASPQLLAQSNEELKKGFETQNNVTVGSVVQSIIISIILVFVLALIFAALFKREPPVYAQVVE